MYHQIAKSYVGLFLQLRGVLIFCYVKPAAGDWSIVLDKTDQIRYFRYELSYHTKNLSRLFVGYAGPQRSRGSEAVFRKTGFPAGQNG